MSCILIVPSSVDKIELLEPESASQKTSERTVRWNKPKHRKADGFIVTCRCEDSTEQTKDLGGDVFQHTFKTLKPGHSYKVIVIATITNCSNTSEKLQSSPREELFCTCKLHMISN